MQIKTLSTSQLFARLKKLSALERRIGVEILEALRELERRKAYADLGYDGLYTYCVKELGFTESQAYQRIQAMRAVAELPELKPKIESGALTVSAVAKVQTHLRQEKKMGVRREPVEKLVLFQAVENCSSREVDMKLAAEKGEEVKPKLVLELDSELETLWEKVKGLSAHRTHGSPEEIFRMLAREWLKRNDPTREARSERKSLVSESSSELADRPNAKALDFPNRESNEPRSWASAVSNGAGDRDSSQVDQETARRESQVRTSFSRDGFGPSPAQSFEWPSSKRIAVSAHLKRQIWRRDQSRCTNCKTKFAIQSEHRLPVARGGKNTPSNLKLLCRSCNLRAGIRIFGLEKMRR